MLNFATKLIFCEMQDLKMSNTGFPSSLVSNSVKESDKYGLAYGNAIEEEWFKKQNSNSVFYNQRLRFQEYRAYRMGNQSPDRYKKYLNPTGDTAYLNLDYTPVAIIPKFVDIIKNSIVDQFFKVNAKAIDPIAQSEKEKERNKIIAKMKMKEALEKLGSQQAAEAIKKKGIPENEEELDLFMSTNFKMAVEIAIEQAIEYTFDLNDFDEKVFSQIVDDIITLGIGACRVTTHPNKGVVTRYVDSLNLVYSYARSPYFDDIVYAGEVIYMTISEIREKFNIQDEELLSKIAKKCEGKYGNPTLDNWSYKYIGAFNENELFTSQYPYDKFKVQLLDFEFITDFKDKYEKKETRYGNSTFLKKGEDYKPSKRSKYKRELYTDSYQCVLGGYKVVGEQYIFDYGKKTNLPRSKDNIDKTCLSFKIVAPNLKDNFFTSMVQRMTPWADAMMEAHLKRQQIQQTQRPPGLAIDVDALEEIDIGGGQKLTPIEIIDMYDQTGNFVFRGRNYDGGYGTQSPIREIAQSYIGLINEQITAYNFALQQLRDVTGLNEVRDATQPSPEQAVGTAQLALMQSNNATKHINAGAFGLVKNVAKDVVLRIQDIFEYDSKFKNAYKEAIGAYDVKLIDMMDGIPAYMFGINIEVELSQEEKMQLMQDVQIAIQSGQIDISDKYMIQSMTNMKDAQRYLAYKVSRNREIAQQERLQNIQAQGQVNQQNEMAKQQAEMQKMQMEYQFKNDFEDRQLMRDLERIKAENQGDIREEAVRGEYDVAEQKVRAESDRANKKYLEDRKDERTRFEKTAQSKIMKEQKSDNPESIDFTEQEEESLDKILGSNES